MSDSIHEKQRRQFEKISKNYDQNNDSSDVFFNVSHLYYFDRLKGSKVLDVGNGGLSPGHVLGEQLKDQVAFFVGVDCSMDMLKRTPNDYYKVGTDGFNLPFKDKAFDYVLLNGVIHHLGYESGEDHYKKVASFISELRRVCAKEIIVYEIFLSKPWELVERMFARLVGVMPTFVLSSATLAKYFTRMGIQAREQRLYTLSDLFGPFYFYLLVLEYPWFKLPAFLSPIKHGYFTIPGVDSLNSNAG